MTEEDPGPAKRFVGRGGEKLDSALSAFGLEVADACAVDLGANVGGFTDCLLQRGARTVYAVETGYGVLEWKLRQDPRVVVMERTNALHVELPELVDLAVIDVGWTPMRLILPKALMLVAPGGQICALLKPQYEADRGTLKGGVVPADEVEDLVGRTIEQLRAAGLPIHGRADSPIKGAAGNREFFLLLIREG